MSGKLSLWMDLYQTNLIPSNWLVQPVLNREKGIPSLADRWLTAVLIYTAALQLKFLVSLFLVYYDFYLWFQMDLATNNFVIPDLIFT